MEWTSEICKWWRKTDSRTFHDGGAPEPEFTGVVDGKWSSGFRVDDHGLGGRGEKPRRAVAAALVQGVGGGPNPGGFGEAVALKDGDVGVLFHKALGDLFAEWGPTGENRVEGAEVVLCPDGIRVVEHGDQDGRHQGEEGGPELVDGG